MSNKEILKNNKFADCNKESLERYWEELKNFYQNGWVSSDTALGKMRDAYCDEFPAGIIVMEQDLLRAIACSKFN